jgi:predicted nucleic acid-binding Zn ribbon protein
MINDRFSTGNRQCPVCGDRFNGRKDKRYCSDDCRSASNRSSRQAAEAPLMEILSVLRKNRSILKRISAGKKILVSRERLDALGFDASVFSSIHINNRNQTYYFCADYGFLPIHSDGFAAALIIPREPYAVSPDPWKKNVDG